jgi:hypothetical protein
MMYFISELQRLEDGTFSLGDVLSFIKDLHIGLN